MAKISITLSDVAVYSVGTSDVNGAAQMTETKDNITMATDRVGVQVYLPVDEKATKILQYSINILDFSFMKKMYQPTEIIVTLDIATSEGTTFEDINRKVIDNMFKYVKVSVKDGEGTFSEGSEFYVQEVLPFYSKDSNMQVVLKIYSLDKLMTLKESCRTFVSKKLGEEILATEIAKYIKPWTVVNTDAIDAIIAKDQKKLDKDKEVKLAHKIKEQLDQQELTTAEIANLTKEISDKEAEKEEARKPEVPVACTTDNMQILKYDTGKEHIFPYLVQYNESFYDFLARTTNRWGEFMYYENDKLNIGYDGSASVTTVSKEDFQSISFFNLDSKQLRLATDGVYDYEADNSSLTGKPLQKSPNSVKGQLFAFGGKEDKWLMKQFASIFKNDKNLPTMMTNMLFDNLWGLAIAESAAAMKNRIFNQEYFKNYNTNNVHYGQYNFAKKGEKKKELDGFQEFTELDTKFNGKKYKSILENEQTVGQDAICINYGTTLPKLRLGGIISYNNEKFIVVEVTGGFDADRALVFQVIATAQCKDGLFYPAVIPAGHVRYASPQIATITSAKDPTGKNRVRVRFSWEDIKYNNDDSSKGITDATKEVSSPWLNFASNQNGYPTMGYHYEGNQVMLGFEDGNVERPYVMGGLAADGTGADSVLTSEGMHSLTLSDGTGAGMQAFLSGAFAPMAKTLTGFAPGLIPSWKWDKDKIFEGGFELSDYYGIYKVSGSTDGRNVSIASNWGDVKINAFTGITISAPNGDVSITGKNVSIRAGNNLTLESGTNVNYKLWKSKDTTKGTAAQIMLDMTAQVAKKLAEIALNVFDLTLVRSTVEIFFRPVEGSLTLKSNRFLKLSAGNNNCSFPASAFNVEEKMKMLDEMNKKAIMQSAGIGNGMVKLFNIIPSITGHLIKRYVEKYNACVNSLELVKLNIQMLQIYANNQEEKSCHTYDDLKADLWGQDKDEDWNEDKLGFSDNVAVEGTYNNIVSFDCANRIFPISRQYTSANLDLYLQRDEIIVCRRRELREMITEEFNTLRKNIFELTHLELTKQDVDKEFGHFILRQMPKDYKKKVLTAFSKAKSGIEFSDEDKELNGLMELSDDGIKYMRRQVVMNLLEEFGFKDDMRRPIQIDGNILPSVPAKPDGDNMDEGNGNSIMNDECWNNYVNSLSGVPPLGKDLTAVGGALLNAVSSGLEAEKNKLTFWKGAAEIKTWGEGKNGQILFGSGKDTYALKDNQFEKVESLKSSITSLSDASDGLDDDDKKSLQGFVEQLRDVLLKF